MSYNLKITVHNNQDYEQDFTILDENNDPYDLTGCKLSFAIATRDGPRPIALHVSGTSSNKCIFIDNAATGAVRLVLPYTVLKFIEPETYIHDCVIINGAGKRIGVWSGVMVVKKGAA